MQLGIEKNNCKSEHIKYMFIARLPNSKFASFGMLTDSFKFNMTEFRLNGKDCQMCHEQILKYKNIFKKFNIDENTEICMSNTFSHNHSLRMFIEILKQVCKLNVQYISNQKVMNGINRAHCFLRKVKLDDIKINWQVWKFFDSMVKDDSCEWIKRSDQIRIDNMMFNPGRRNMFTRLALYYMAIRHVI